MRIATHLCALRLEKSRAGFYFHNEVYITQVSYLTELKNNYDFSGFEKIIS